VAYISHKNGGTVNDLNAPGSIEKVCVAECYLIRVEV